MMLIPSFGAYSVADDNITSLNPFSNLDFHLLSKISNRINLQGSILGDGVLFRSYAVTLTVSATSDEPNGKRLLRISYSTYDRNDEVRSHDK